MNGLGSPNLCENADVLITGLTHFSVNLYSALINADVAQTVRAGVSYALGQWFDSTHRHYWKLFEFGVLGG